MKLNYKKNNVVPSYLLDKYFINETKIKTKNHFFINLINEFEKLNCFTQYEMSSVKFNKYARKN